MINSSLEQYRALLARQQLLYQQQHKRLSRRIHDDVSQNLTLLSLQLSLALTEPGPPSNWSEMCEQWANLVQELGQNLRNIVNEVQPRIIDDLGLGAALQWYVNSTPNGVQCQLLLPREPASLAPVAANELFTICRDIVSDLLAPNGIKKASIELAQSNEQLRLHVRVAGNHPDLGPLVSKALDALSIHERLFCVDGGIDVEEHAVKGLTITLSVPAATRQTVVPHAA